MLFFFSFYLFYANAFNLNIFYSFEFVQIKFQMVIEMVIKNPNKDGLSTFKAI